MGNADFDGQLADAVLAYLSECPNAMDTAEGVTDWWLARQHVRVQVEAIARVLNALVERGVLEKVGTALQERYRLTRD